MSSMLILKPSIRIRDENSEGYNREVDKNFAEVDEFNFNHNEKIIEHEVKEKRIT